MRYDEGAFEQKCVCGRSLRDCVTPDCIVNERLAPPERVPAPDAPPSPARPESCC